MHFLGDENCHFFNGHTKMVMKSGSIDVRGEGANNNNFYDLFFIIIF